MPDALRSTVEPGEPPARRHRCARDDHARRARIPRTVADRRVGTGDPAGAAQPLWMVRYRIALVTLDLCCMIVATIVGYELRFGLLEAKSTQALSYLGVGGLLSLGWVIAVQNAGGYEVRHLATGPEEAKRVLRASAITLSALAIVCYATKTQLARGFVVGVIPVGVMLILLERLAVRRYVHARRERHDWIHRILVVGTAEAARHLLDVTERASGAGLRVAAVCADDLPDRARSWRRACRWSAGSATPPARPSGSTPTSSPSPAAASARSRSASWAGSWKAPGAAW